MPSLKLNVIQQQVTFLEEKIFDEMTKLNSCIQQIEYMIKRTEKRQEETREEIYSKLTKYNNDIKTINQ